MAAGDKIVLVSEAQLTTALGQKVDKTEGKQLSTEDFTTAEKTKLSGINTEATSTPIDDEAISSTSVWSSQKVNEAVNQAIAQIPDDEESVAPIISKPQITSPINGEILASDYAPSDNYIGVVSTARWEAATDINFTNIIDSSYADSRSVWEPAVAGLSEVQVFVRMCWESGGHLSDWADAVSFTTSAIHIETPALAVSGDPDAAYETPTFTTSPLSVFNGTDTHLNTDWKALDNESGTVIWTSLADTVNLTSITIPAGFFEESKSYTVSARHRGDTYGVSEWVDKTITTRDEFFNDNSALDGLAFDAMAAAGNYDEATDTGYFGEVSSTALFTGAALASAIGLTAGTSQHSTEGWLKFYVGASATCNYYTRLGETAQAYILYIAKKPYRNNISWDDIYARGAVYGSGDVGVSPAGTATTQDATVTKWGASFSVRLMTGINSDPMDFFNKGCSANVGGDSEWNQLMYRVHTDVPACPAADNYDGGAQVGGNWETFTGSDLIIGSGDGRVSWTQETDSENTAYRANRGIFRLSSLSRGTSPYSVANYGWRPALMLS